MTEQNIDHAQVMVPPPLVFLGYLIGALILNWIMPFPAPWTFVLRIVGGLTVIAEFLLAGLAILTNEKSAYFARSTSAGHRIRDHWTLSFHAQPDLSRILFDLSWIHTISRNTLGLDRFAVSNLDDNASGHPRRGNLSRRKVR